MKILFIMLHPGYIRNYESVITMLAERGHELYLCFNLPNKQKNDIYEEIFSQKYKNIYFNKNRLPKREDLWKGFVKIIRGSIDYIRYLHPMYANCSKLIERIENRIKNYSLILLKILRILNFILGRNLIKLLKLLEEITPPSKKITEYLRNQNPDLILITPLVNFSSSQIDYVKSAKFLGIKCGLCVASWDNLTNKGLIQIEPDIIFVWNEIQKFEALNFHGISPEKIFITGAQCFDKWFERKPATLRKNFCEKVGLDPNKPYILYLCSSPFISPQEVPFVEKWIRHIRTHENVYIKDIGILIRPHPQNFEQWKDVDFSHFRNVVIYPRTGDNPIDDLSKSDFYDSIFHAIAVVGINTTAMIEAGILEKSVFTIISPDFRDTQEGTIHFNYLVKSGFLNISNNLNEHIEQLINVLLNDTIYNKERIRSFIKSFIRPHGLNIPSTPIFVKAIEEFGKMNFGCKKMPLWLYPLRLAFVTMAIILLKIMRMKKSKKFKND